MKHSIEERLIWFDGKIVPVNEAKINVLAPTSQFGLNVFEGIRCYWNEEKQNLYAFRLQDHLKRLKRSQALLKLENKYTIEELEKAFFDVIIAEDYREDIAVRQTLFVDGFQSWSSRENVNMFIAPSPKAKTNPEYNKDGLNCCISSWERINDKALSPRIKCGANYINSRMAQIEALENGYDTAIFLNKLGHVAEGPGSCLFMVKNGQLVTPLLTDSVLESITRDTIIQIARKCLNVEVVERSIDRTELYMCDEAFLCGSAMEITPIYSVDKYTIGNGSMGSVTKTVLDKYIQCVLGENEMFREWVTPVYG